MGFHIKRPSKIRQGDEPGAARPRLTVATDLILKWVSIAAIVIGGGWAFYLFILGGADDWMVNLSMTTDVVPYRNNLRLLEIHIKTKNPRNTEFDFGPPTDRFILTIRNVPTDLESGTAFDAERGTPIATVNLMPADGYQLVPNAEFDDMAVIVLPAGSIVALSAAWQAGNDRVSVEKLVKIEP